MKKKKYIFLIVLIGILIIGSITVLANQYSLRYDEQGRLIIPAGDTIPDEVEDGTPIALEVPDFNKKNYKNDYNKEKNSFLSEVESDSYKPIDYSDVEVMKDEIPFVKVMKKYYGEKEIVDLYNKIDEERENNQSKQLIDEITETQIKGLTMTCDLIENKNLTSEEKEILINALKSIDLSSLKDIELKNRISKY